MLTTHTRREFLQWSAATGAGLLVTACTPIGVRESFDPQRLPLLVKPGDPRYDVLRRNYNLRIDTFPAAIAPCRSTGNVAESIRYARAMHLPVAVRSGGHSMEGFSSNNDGLVINLAEMDDVELRSDHTLRVGPGCTLSRLYDAVLPRGRLLPAGSCGTVAVGGLTLGGGYGFFSRQYGLTCDHLRSATMVDGTGTIRLTRDDPELLWALRGGGAGNFGVVTEMEFDSQPAPALFHAHRFKVRHLRATTAKAWLEKWFSFSAQLPNTCFSAFVLNGSTLTVLTTSFADSDAELRAQVAAFAEAAEPSISSASAPPGIALKRYYGSLEPLYFKNASAGFYRGFADVAGVIEQVLARVIATPGMIYQVNTMGGNIAAPRFETVSCYAHRQFGFISELQAYWQHAGQADALLAATREIQQMFSAHGIAAQYVNYCSTDFAHWPEAYYAENYARLQAIKRRYDPDDRIRHPQSVRA